MRMKPQLRKISEAKRKRSWRFVRVMPTRILYDNMQGIPGEFASKFSSETSTFASLTVANQHNWTVKVSKTKNKLRLCTGWEKFVGDNSINDGCMMVFKYKGNCDFNVHLFDPCGTEIQCSPGMTDCSGEQRIGSCEDIKQKGTPYIAVKEEEKEEEEGEEGDDKEDELKSGSGTKQATRSGGSSRGLSKENATDHEEEEGSIELQAFLLSLKNPFFCPKIRSGSRQRDLLVPSDVIQTYGLKFDTIISLEDSKRRKFQARVITWKDGRTWLTQGWKRLCKYNMISDDDTCYCEFIPSKGPTSRVIKVHIFRDQK